MSQIKPNIVYILADDLGYGDVGCLNPESKIPTPRHDQLAREGMTFTDAHSNSAVCTPTRYGVLTGRYCFRSSLKGGVLGGYDDMLIEPGRMTVASMLKEQGYHTACIGKWHLGLGWQRSDSDESFNPERPGWSEDPRVDYAKPVTAGPHTCGFDQSFIIPASLDIIPYCYIENGQVVERPTDHCEDNPRPAMWRGGPIAPGMQHETCLQEFTARATQFISDHTQQQSDQPFFLYLPLPSPHTPHVPRKPFVGKSEAGPYGDYVVEHDWSVGQVLDTLERHGLTDDTLVIVTSDNGPHRRGDGFDFEQQYGHRSSYIYRGQKSDNWDGGHRVPFFVRWPGHVEAGSTCDDTICLTDFLRTAASLLDVKLPEDAGEDSFDISPMLLGAESPPQREATVHHSVVGWFAIRSGRWKLLTHAGSGGWSEPSFSQVEENNSSQSQLYDMETDPGETQNIYSEHPEIVEKLESLLDRYRVSNRSVQA